MGWPLAALLSRQPPLGVPPRYARVDETGRPQAEQNVREFERGFSRAAVAPDTTSHESGCGRQPTTPRVTSH